MDYPSGTHQSILAKYLIVVRQKKYLQETPFYFTQFGSATPDAAAAFATAFGLNASTSEITLSPERNASSLARI
jgi:hypothetical protein